GDLTSQFDADDNNNQVVPGYTYWDAYVKLDAGTFAWAGNAAAVSENAGVVNLTINRTGGSAGSVTVNLIAGAGTATPGAGNDFTFPSSVTFNPGDTTKAVPVTINDDSVPEPGPPETFSLIIQSASNGGTVGAPNS